MPQFFKHSLFIQCLKLKKTLMFHKSNNYWETLPLLDYSWLCFSFPRKSCCDSRFLHLHQFLSGNFLACSLIWTFTSQSSCSPPCFHPAWSSHTMPLFRLQYRCVTSSRFTEREQIFYKHGYILNRQGLQTKYLFGCTAEIRLCCNKKTVGTPLLIILTLSLKQFLSHSNSLLLLMLLLVSWIWK